MKTNSPVPGWYLVTRGLRAFVAKGLQLRLLFIFPSSSLPTERGNPVNRATKPGNRKRPRTYRPHNRYVPITTTTLSPLSLSLSLVVICRLLFPASLTRLSPRRNGYILSAEIFRKLDRCFLAEAVPCAGYVTMGATLPTSLIQRYNTMNRPDTLAYGYTQCLVHSSDATSCTLPTLEN